MRNMDSPFNKEGFTEHIVEVNIYYQRYRERMKIDVIKRQKQSIILGILWLTCHNPEIDWKIEKVKITRYLEEYKKQQRSIQRKCYD